MHIQQRLTDGNFQGDVVSGLPRRCQGMDERQYKLIPVAFQVG